MIDLSKIHFCRNRYTPTSVNLLGEYIIGRVETLPSDYDSETLEHAKICIRQEIWNHVYGDLIPLVCDLGSRALRASKSDEHSQILELCNKIETMLSIVNRPKEV